MPTPQEKFLDKLTTQLAANPDLRSDVLPFLLPTIAKLKQIASFIEDKKQDNMEAYYEFNSICTNYLPTTIQSFCSLPIEYRNTKVLKNNKTARELLIEDLQKIIAQTDVVEDSLLSKEEKAFLVNNTYLSGRLDTKSAPTPFENQFNYKSWAETPEGTQTYIVSPSAQQALEQKKEAKERADAKNQALAEAQKLAAEKRLKLEKFKSGVYSTIAGFASGSVKFMGEALPFILVVGGIGAAGYGVSFPLRAGDNRDDVEAELRYVQSILGERRDFTVKELQELSKKVDAIHADKVGDFYPLTTSVENNTLRLSYTLSSGACSAISTSLFRQFFDNNLNASFKVDGLTYQKELLTDATALLGVEAYYKSKSQYKEDNYRYNYLVKSLQDDKSLLTGEVKKKARNLDTDPVGMAVSQNGLADEGFGKVCSPSEVKLDVVFNPNETPPVFKPKMR